MKIRRYKLYSHAAKLAIKVDTWGGVYGVRIFEFPVSRSVYLLNSVNGPILISILTATAADTRYKRRRYVPLGMRNIPWSEHFAVIAKAMAACKPCFSVRRRDSAKRARCRGVV